MIDSWVLLGVWWVYQREPDTTVQTMGLPRITKLHFNAVGGRGDFIFINVNDTETRNSRALKNSWPLFGNRHKLYFRKVCVSKQVAPALIWEFMVITIETQTKLSLATSASSHGHFNAVLFFRVTSLKTKINWISINKSLSSCFSWQYEVLPALLHWR